jgi:hypothetical protein
MANIARVTAILECSNDPNLRQALRYAQRAWIQLNQQNPASTVREEHVGKSRSQPNSRTVGDRPRPQRSNNNDNARGSQQPPPEATRDSPIIRILQKTCARKLVKGAMRDP